MRQALARWQQKYQHWMIGRYGVIDTLNKHLMIVVIVMMIIQLFIKSSIISLVEIVCLIVVFYRLFSKRIYVRSNENQKYRSFIQKCKHPIINIKQFMSDRKTYKYITCKNCRKKMRVPRGHGKVRVTCPACHEKFEVRT